MARKGLANPVFAPITTETPGSPIVYGEPVLLPPAIAANVSFERNSNPLWGSNVIVENDNGIIGGTVTFNATHLTPENRKVMLGVEERGESPEAKHYVETAAPAPTGGFGYITYEQEHNVPKFTAFWIYKVQFAMNEEAAQTRAGGIEWGTPTVEGTMMGVDIDGSGVPAFRAFRVFGEYSDAKVWVDGMSGIKVKVATPTAVPPAGEVVSGATVVLSTTTAGAVIHYTADGAAPTAQSPVYSVPIEVTEPVTIKAIATKAGMENSAVMTAAYTLAG